jgi:hypothetical protein
LTWQLSSLCLHAPQDVAVTYTVFYCPEDKATEAVLRHFEVGCRKQDGSRVVVFRWWPLERRQLMRRAIGRNLAARSTQAQWVWFADADYLFGRGCLDALARALGNLPADCHLAFPRIIQASKSHEHGDRYIDRVKLPDQMADLLDVEPADFEPAVLNRAIGGIQIVRGDVARERGYLPDTEWQHPADTWQQTFEDPVFRQSMGTNGTPVDIPNCYRIRHSKRGRFDVGVRL